MGAGEGGLPKVTLKVSVLDPIKWNGCLRVAHLCLMREAFVNVRSNAHPDL